MNRFVARVRRPGLCLASWGLLLASIAASGWWTPRSWADASGPQPNDRQVALTVRTLLEREHLSKHPLDEEMSRMCFQALLKLVDPWKDFLTQADIDALAKQQDDLCNQIKRGDTSFIYTVYTKLLERMDERAKLVDEMLTKEIDFTVDEERVMDLDAVRFAQNDDEIQDKWRKRVKYDLLMYKAEGMKAEDTHERVSRHYHALAKRTHQMSSGDLLEVYLVALSGCFDPHTSYMSPSTSEEFDIRMRLQLDGIGASLQNDDGNIVVVALQPGGAAEKDGHLKVKDRLLGVGQGTGGDIVDVMDMNLNEVVKLVRGKAGTVVRLKVVSVGQNEPKIYDITRASIELKDSAARGEIFEDSVGEAKQKIGFIDLPSFYMDMTGARQGLHDYRSTTRDVRKILADFRAKNVDAVILDLRRNGGGSVPEAISLTGLFIDDGPIVQVKDSGGHVQHYDDPEKGTDWSGPLVVLTSKLSASASEIFAGAIKDYHRGLIVGDHATHGKGLMQSVIDLKRQLFQDSPGAPSLGTLKVTMQQFYRPSGDSTQERGVEADIELPSVTTYWDVGEEDLEHHMKFDHVDPIAIDKLQMVDGALVSKLRALSEERCDKSPDFEKVRQNIARYKRQKEHKAVPLNEEKFFADRGDPAPEKDEDDDSADDKSSTIKRSFYIEETLSITHDYLRLMKVQATTKNG